MNTARSACLAVWLSSCGILLVDPFPALAGAIAPKSPLSRVETPVIQYTDDDDSRWVLIEESHRYGYALTGSPGSAPWNDEQSRNRNTENLLSTHELIGPSIARQLDQESRQSVEDILSLDSFTPGAQSGLSSATGQRPGNGDRSRLFDLAEEILQPVKQGDGVISFSITGLGTFIVSREQDTGDLHIRELSSDLSATIKRNALSSSQNGNGEETAAETQIIETPMTFYQLFGKIVDLLFGGPQILILVLILGLWASFRMWLKMRTRSSAG